MLKASPPYQVIQSKFNRPPLDRRWNARPRLIQQLDKYEVKRLTLISAPAGYGKTTLAVQWAVQRPQFTAWLSVDPGDSDSERFIRYLALAIKVIHPDFGPNTTALLTAPVLASPEYLADALISDLSIIDGMLTIIIDDFHSIEDEAVHQIMIRLIQNLPVNLHLLILTRMDPPWPIGAFRGRGWFCEIRAVDLRFSEDESRRYLHSGSGKNLTDPLLNALHHKTEGWVAGLQLAQLSIGTGKTPEAFATEFSGSDRFIADFLVDEVLAGLPDEIRDFLAVTALLDGFCASLCDCLLPEGGDSSRLIEEVEKRNLFLVPLDNERRWFRYHHLFQTLLIRHLLVDYTPEKKRQLHFRAGTWFAGEGLVEEALKHLIASRHVDAAALLFSEHLHTVIEKDLTRRTLFRWMNMFPEETRNEHPALLAARICYLTYHWDLPGMMLLMDKAQIRLRDPACSLDEPTRRNLDATVDAQRSFCLYWLGDAEGSLRHARRALEVLPREHNWAYTVAILYKAASLAAVGRGEEALEFLSDIVSDDCSVGSRNFGTILAARMAIHLNAGNLTGVRDAAQEVLKVHETVPVPIYWRSHAYYFLGSVAYEQNNLDDAADHFGMAEQAIYQVNSRVYHDCLLGLALVAETKQEPAKALEYAERAKLFAIEMNDAVSRLMSESLSTRLALLSGKEPIEPISLKATNEGLKFWLEIPTLTLAEYLIRKPEPDYRRALAIIEEALNQAKQQYNRRQEIQFLAVKAVALRCAGETDQALETLKESLRMAEPLGFVRAFIDRGPLMAELLNKLLNTRSIAQYVRLLLDEFENTASHKKAATAFIDSLLTKRELKILEMLALRLTYREIADKLFISPATVKTHVSSIYRKLNVSGRLEAIGSARTKGLLPVKK